MNNHTYGRCMELFSYLQPPRCTITRMGGAYGAVMGEYVVGYIIASERGMLHMAKEQHTKEFTNMK